MKRKNKEEKETHQKDITEKTKELEKLKRQLEDEKRKNEDKKGVQEDGNVKMIKDLEKSIEELQRKHKADVEDLKKKHNEENEKHKETITEKTKELEKVTRQLKDETGKNKDKEAVRENENVKRIKELENIIEELKTENKILQEDFEKRKSKNQPKLTKTSDDILALKEENDSLKNRLSQLAGAKLTEGNPNIADLSDKNRPINLAEKFSELYDNEWTDALEEIMDNEKKSEEEGINVLFHIVKDAYEFCSKQSTTLYKSMTEGIKNLGLSEETLWPQGLSKQIKDHRKSISVLVSNNLSKEFLETQKHKGGKATTKYAEACAVLCWFMCVQDPPVYMDPSVPTGNFDTDKYRAYTKTGKDYKFLVWPPLYLHKDGPMLGKGIAQGK
ncbi:myosin-9-like [Saccostrea cucullata]|uniref:myosin-9-like n=1 Tax=Saccostrea cuccullata TaxID=36930 RepID=UPI002ED1C23F